MAALTLPAPGSEFGPCLPAELQGRPCSHTDCALTRAQADDMCCYCASPIGYNRAHYRDGLDGNGIFHVECWPANLDPATGREWAEGKDVS